MKLLLVFLFCVVLCGCGGGDHEEQVDQHVEIEGGERVAWVTVVPHEDLHRDQKGRVEEKHRTEEEHYCGTEERENRDS